MWFVYVQGPLGPEPQKWAEDTAFDMGANKERETLLKVHLPVDHERYSLDHLSTLYPLLKKDSEAIKKEGEVG